MAPENISNRQFEFMIGRSAEDAVVKLQRMISFSEMRYAVVPLFDISSAFDNVWPLVLESLKDRKRFRRAPELLSRLKYQIKLGHKVILKKATRRCPQASLAQSVGTCSTAPLVRTRNRTIRGICRQPDSQWLVGFRGKK